MGFKNIAVFYQYDAFGEAVKKGAEIALAKYGMVPVAYGNFQRNTMDIEEGLKRTGQNLSCEAYIDAVETIRNFGLGGVSVNYGPDDHVGFDKVTITHVKDGKPVELKNWSEVK